MKETEEPVPLSFIHGWGGTLRAHTLMQEIYDDFDAKNEDIVLSSQPSSDSSIAVEKANDMLALDEMPNIVSTNGQAPSNPQVDNQVIAEEYPVLGNALETAHRAEIHLKTITSVWNSETIEVISAEIEKASKDLAELEQMIRLLEAANHNE